MPDQPKRSAFDPDPPKVKGVPESQREKSSDSSDKSTTPNHEKGLIDSIKGLIASHASTSGNKQEASALSALESGVNDAPGNSADY